MNDETLQQVVFDGIRFLESLIEYYGTDKGMEVWEAMGNAVGREVKGRIFFAMVSGEFTNHLKFRAGNAELSGNAVPVIKSIRSYTGLSLKETKDLWDHSKTNVTVIKGEPDEIRKLRVELRLFGCDVF